MKIKFFLQVVFVVYLSFFQHIIFPMPSSDEEDIEEMEIEDEEYNMVSEDEEDDVTSDVVENEKSDSIPIIPTVKPVSPSLPPNQVIPTVLPAILSDEGGEGSVDLEYPTQATSLPVEDVDKKGPSVQQASAIDARAKPTQFKKPDTIELNEKEKGFLLASKVSVVKELSRLSDETKSTHKQMIILLNSLEATRKNFYKNFNDVDIKLNSLLQSASAILGAASGVREKKTLVVKSNKKRKLKQKNKIRK
jgi:hypothetical protein